MCVFHNIVSRSAIEDQKKNQVRNASRIEREKVN